MRQVFPKLFFNIFFPRRCQICQRSLHDKDLCSKCFEKIPVFGWVFCAHCEARLPSFHSCGVCARKIALMGIGSATDYRRKDVRALIQAYKYRRRKDLSVPLSEILIRHAELSGLADYLSSTNAIVTPIPLTKSRERQRGFNQAALLAEKLSASLELDYFQNTLKRVAERHAQVTMTDAKSRLTNIAGVFEPTNHKIIRHNTFLLVDDVTTSGATLKEAAKTLRRAGAKAVWGITVARGH